MNFNRFGKRHATKLERRRALIQYAWGAATQKLLAIAEPVHERYCRTYGVDYRVTREDRPLPRHPTWQKVELLANTLRLGYEQVAWIDADCIIVDSTFNIFDASGFGIAVCECFDSPNLERHLNTGVMLATRSDDVLAFLELWKAMPAGGKWEDQSGFIALMASRPHRDLLTILPNRFNCVDVHMEARNPVIRAFHGDAERHNKMAALVRDLQ